MRTARNIYKSWPGCFESSHNENRILGSRGRSGIRASQSRSPSPHAHWDAPRKPLLATRFGSFRESRFRLRWNLPWNFCEVFLKAFLTLQNFAETSAHFSPGTSPTTSPKVFAGKLCRKCRRQTSPSNFATQERLYSCAAFAISTSSGLSRTRWGL